METGSALRAIQSATAALELFAQGKGIALRTPSQDDVFFRADAQRVQQIVLNLLSNAIKFTPHGGSVAVTCGVSAAGPGTIEGPRGDWVRIDVTDTGVGIPQDQIQRMFEPFVRGDGEGAVGTPGAGLGLAISRRLAEMMSGAITVESIPGEGARFTLWLRAAPEQTGARRVHTPSPLEAQAVPHPHVRPPEGNEPITRRA